MTLTAEETRERQRAYDRMRRVRDREKKAARDKAYYEARRDQINAQRRQDRLDRPEHYAALERARYERDREKRLEAQRAYRAALPEGEMARRNRVKYSKNREAVRAVGRKWALEHPEEMRAFKRAYKKANPTRGADDTALRRARQRGLPFERIDRLAVYVRDDGWCYICGYAVDPDDFQLDHVIPVARGGPHLYSNVATTHAICNQRKNALPPERWLVAV